MARARLAPKMRLEGARKSCKSEECRLSVCNTGRDILSEPLKDAYYQEAAGFLNDAATVANDVGEDESSTIVAFLSRGKSGSQT